MGMLDQLLSSLGGGGQQQVQSMANGQGNFADPNSPDHAGLAGMIQHVPPGVLQQVLGQVAGQMSPQAYAQHATPGAGGTDPFGGLKGAALSMVAGALMSRLTGGGGGAGLSPQSLMSQIPGLSTTDPSQMNSGQVAQVAQYAQQNHPQAFGQAAADVGQQQPGLLGTLLGHAGLSQGAAGLASHFLGQR